ncbi:hypothetical protein [Streptomyces sp. SID11385]|uniref:hypothetical protein n=1 Tax=Streptomyces sp. SID11385 TaxID=2706031 RepID=UPI0013C6258A|nr:hypothetical protein [Streptomyces sp. SID11385]NEA39197.1 hypothetical protein [Streptomyces sp. SID11385]
MMERSLLTSRIIGLGLTLGVLLGGVVACSSDSESKTESEKNTQAEAPSSAEPGSSATEGSASASPPDGVDSGTLAELRNSDLVVVVKSAVRDKGGYVTVEGNVTNSGSRSWVGADWKSDENELRNNGGSLAGASLVDQEGKKRYLILRDTSGKCLCTKFDSALRQGQSADWFAQFPAPPASTKKVTFQVGSMPPAEIPLSEAR